MKQEKAVALQHSVHLFIFFVSLLLILIPLFNKTPSTEVSEKSLYAAAEFLLLVDTEEYAQSWEVASEALKGILSRDVWNKEIEEIRAFLGPVVERVQHKVTYTDSAPDVPPGEYVVMTFVSRFEFKEKVVETLTLMLNDQNEWRVAGYFLR
jgi:hypothetical protein